MLIPAAGEREWKCFWCKAETAEYELKCERCRKVSAAHSYREGMGQPMCDTEFLMRCGLTPPPGIPEKILDIFRRLIELDPKGTNIELYKSVDVIIGALRDG